jgi:hypothetical protein
MATENTAGWKGLGVGAVVIFELRRLKMALKLLEFPSHLYRCSTDAVTNSNPAYSHHNTGQYLNNI